MNPFKKYWEGLSERKQAGIRYAANIFILVFTVWVSVSVISYICNWKEDQSALAAGGAVQNAAASTGLSAGHFLVTDSFGLAALCLVLFLLVLCLKRFWSGYRASLRKWFYGMLSFSFILSWILAFAGRFLDLEFAFGGGLGGRAGAALVNWSVLKVGEIVTLCILVALFVIWLFCMSRRFSDLLMGKKKVEAPVEVALEEIVEVEDLVPVEPVVEEAPAFASTYTTVESEKPEEEEPEAPAAVEEEEKKEEEDGSFNVVTDDTLEQEVKEPLKPIDNRLDPPDGLPRYKTPDFSILEDYTNALHKVQQDELVRNNTLIRNTLASYKIQVRDVTAIVGPTVTLYKVYPAPGVKISAIKQLQEDIGINLQARGVRIVTLADSVGIEVANDKASIVPLKNLLNSEAFRESKAELPVAIGYTISQQVKVFDLADAPHLLVAGATKQGKSVGLNVIVASLLYSKHPSELKFVFIDPKMVEFSSYGRLLHHYLAVLPNAVSEQEEMDRLYYEYERMSFRDPNVLDKDDAYPHSYQA